MWKVIKEKILEGVDKYVPSSLPFSSWKKTAWKQPISASIRNLMRQKGKLWKRYIQSKDPKVLSSYKQIRNIVRNKTRQTDRLNQNEIAKACKDNPKHF